MLGQVNGQLHFLYIACYIPLPKPNTPLEPLVSCKACNLSEYGRSTVLVLGRLSITLEPSIDTTKPVLTSACMQVDGQTHVVHTPC